MLVENLTLNDTMHLILVVYAGYLIGRITDCFIEILNEAIKKIKEKKDNKE